MTTHLDGLEVMHTSVSVVSRSRVETEYPTFPICVPTTIIPFRGRFATLPEILPTLVGKGFKLNMLSEITVGLPKNDKKT